MWQHVKLSDVSLGTQYSLVVDEDVKKPTKQPTVRLLNARSHDPLNLEYLYFALITTDSSLNVLSFAAFIPAIMLVCFGCLVNIGMLAFVGFVAVRFMRAASAQHVYLSSFLFSCSDLEARACSLARFLGTGVSRATFLMCWLTDPRVSSWLEVHVKGFMTKRNMRHV